MASVESVAERWVTTVVTEADVEVLSHLDDAFPGLEHADAAWIATMSESGSLRTIVACEQAIARIQAVQMRALARFDDARDNPRSAAAEVALATSATEARSRQQLALAQTLTTRLPHALTAMESGIIDSYKASKIADATATLDDTGARQADEILADRLAGKNPGGLRQAACRFATKLDPDGADRRAAVRRRERSVELTHQGDGMATLAADLPAETAAAIYTRVDRAARQLRGPQEARNLDQLRADLFAGLCLGTYTLDTDHTGDACTATTTDAAAGPATAAGTATTTSPATTTDPGTDTDAGPARAEIFVYVSAETLAGVSDTPGELAGHGPLPAGLARAMAHQPHTTWRRIVTDPVDGQIIDVGRTRYRPPAALDELVRVRDRSCRHPGCYRPSQHGDIDHHAEWARDGGSTSAANLLGFCRKHHRLKDEPGWAHRLDEDGTLTVTTPAGRAYTSAPDEPPF